MLYNRDRVFFFGGVGGGGTKAFDHPVHNPDRYYLIKIIRGPLTEREPCVLMISSDPR